MKDITVVLVSGGKEIASALTDSEGKYQFSGSILQPGTEYEVKLNLPQTFEKYEIPAYKVNLLPGARRWDVNFGLPCLNFADCSETRESDPAGLAIYPNPDGSVLHFEYKSPGTGQPLLFRIYDLNGRLLESQARPEKKAGDHKDKIPVNTLPSGQYILTFTESSHFSSVKFTKP